MEELPTAASSCTAAKIVGKQTNTLSCRRISDDLKINVLDHNLAKDDEEILSPSSFSES